MSHDHDTPSKWEISVHAALPVVLMLFIQMVANHFGSPERSIFLSPYLIAVLVAELLALVVLWKGQICPGQKGRLIFVLPFLALFAVGNFLYSAITPKHIILALANLGILFIPLLYWRFPDDTASKKIYAILGFLLGCIVFVAYSISYWVELPSLLNWVRGNYFAQIQLGLLLIGWYMMLAKSRLDGFFKLLIQLAAIMLIFNYIWVIFVLYQEVSMMPDLAVTPYFIFFALQFIVLAMLAWLLLGKQGKNLKNPVAWSIATFCSIFYPLTNVI